MADLPTRQELFDRFRAACLATSGTRISLSEITRPGSDVNLVALASTVLGEEIVRRMAAQIAAAYEDTAEGTCLDRVVMDRKGLPRLGASPAVGSVQLTRATAGAGAGTIPGGPPGSTPTPARIRLNTGVEYQLLDQAVFGVSDLSIEVRVQSVLTGTGQATDAGASWSWVDQPFDTSIQIANADPTAGDSDAESDVAYRARAKQFFPTIRRGVLGAIELGLLSVSGVASAQVIEVIDPASGFPAAIVQGFVLDAQGRSNATLAARAQVALLEYRALGIPVQVLPGEVEFIDIEFTGTSFDTAIISDTSAAAEEVRSRCVAALNNQQPGARLYRSTILAAARQVRGFVFEDSDLIEPAGTLIPASSSIAFRTKLEKVTVS